MVFKEQLFIMSGEQSQHIMQDVETMMGNRPYDEVTDEVARITTLCELNDAFAEMYRYQSEKRQAVIGELTDVTVYGALRAVLPPNRRNVSVTPRVAAGTTHRGLVQRSKNFGVYSRTATEQLLLNADTVTTDVTLSQRFASGRLAVEEQNYTFGELGPLLDITLIRAQAETSIRFLPLANLAIFDTARPDVIKHQTVQTVTNLIALMASGASTKAV